MFITSILFRLCYVLLLGSLTTGVILLRIVLLSTVHDAELAGINANLTTCEIISPNHDSCQTGIECNYQLCELAQKYDWAAFRTRRNCDHPFDLEHVKYYLIAIGLIGAAILSPTLESIYYFLQCPSTLYHKYSKVWFTLCSVTSLAFMIGPTISDLFNRITIPGTYSLLVLMILASILLIVSVRDNSYELQELDETSRMINS